MVTSSETWLISQTITAPSTFTVPDEANAVAGAILLKLATSCDRNLEKQAAIAQASLTNLDRPEVAVKASKALGNFDFLEELL